MLMSCEPCTECGDSGNHLTQGDGKCNRCSGSWVDVGVACQPGTRATAKDATEQAYVQACNGTGVPLRAGG